MYRILIVDDEAAERNGMEYLLIQGGYPFSIRKCSNGQEAWEELQRETAHLLITDIKMPFMDGLELCEKAKQQNPEILLLISSAYSDFTYAQKAIQFHVDAYILKPVIVTDFHAAIRRAIEVLSHRKKSKEDRQALLEQYNESNYYEKDKLIQKLLQEEPAAQADAPIEAAEKAAIARAIALIQENFHRDIGLEWVANQIYLSPGYLSGLFKRETGKSVIQYMTLCRMDKARELLIKTNMKVVDVSQRVGYNNVSYFCLIFRKFYGVTANQMRDQERQI